jgi:hypothetical protein
MRRPRAVLGLVALVPVVFVASASSTSPAAKPALRVVDRTPLLVAGRGFHTGERVRVVVRGEGMRNVRRTRASARGTFRVRFEGVSASGCGGGLDVRAVGGAGSTAVAKIVFPLCPP